jgi:hypothetical protein
MAVSVYLYKKNRKLFSINESKTHIGVPIDVSALDLTKSSHRQEFFFQTYWNLVDVFHHLQLMERSLVNGMPKDIEHLQKDLVPLDNAVRKFLERPRPQSGTSEKSSES